MIGLITINDYKNTGNRLQNYAMFKILSSYGNTKNIVRLLDCESKSSKKIVIYRFKNQIKNIVKFFIPGKYHYSAVRQYLFACFNKNIVNGETLSSDTNYKSVNKKYNYFVTGSDQVWNPSFRGNGMYINMLAFTSSEKKIAGCPSVGIDMLSETQEEEFKRYLTDFRYLSCRESAGAELITKITEKECITLIDPTLIIDISEWDRIAHKPFYSLPSNYIVLYFLGRITEEYMKKIEQLSMDKRLIIVNINDPKSKYYMTGPAEFIYLIKNSSMVVTDSYHATIFSLIYNKPVKVLNRIDETKTMNSRFHSLIKTLEIDSSIFEWEKGNSDLISPIKYSSDRLVYEKNKFKSYFNLCFTCDNNRL